MFYLTLPSTFFVLSQTATEWDTNPSGWDSDSDSDSDSEYFIDPRGEIVFAPMLHAKKK